MTAVNGSVEAAAPGDPTSCHVGTGGTVESAPADTSAVSSLLFRLHRDEPLAMSFPVSWLMRSVSWLVRSLTVGACARGLDAQLCL